MGTNLVTGDYSRGAAGFWIENGELTYAVSEVTIAGHLSDMFRTLTPANDLDVQIRHQCADLARGGTDRCRSVSAQLDHRGARRRTRRGLARGRPDRAYALSARDDQKLDQGRQFAGVGSRHRGRQFPARAAQPRRLRLAVGGKPGRSRRGSMPSGFSSSIRSTARAPISRAVRTGRSSRRSWRRAGRSRPRVYVPVDDELYLAAAGSGATRNGEPIAASQGEALAQARVAGPKKFLERLSAIDPATDP